MSIVFFVLEDRFFIFLLLLSILKESAPFYRPTTTVELYGYYFIMDSFQSSKD